MTGTGGVVLGAVLHAQREGGASRKSRKGAGGRATAEPAREGSGTYLPTPQEAQQHRPVRAADVADRQVVAPGAVPDLDADPERSGGRVPGR